MNVVAPKPPETSAAIAVTVGSLFGQIKAGEAKESAALTPTISVSFANAGDEVAFRREFTPLMQVLDQVLQAEDVFGANMKFHVETALGRSNGTESAVAIGNFDDGLGEHHLYMFRSPHGHFHLSFEDPYHGGKFFPIKRMDVLFPAESHHDPDLTDENAEWRTEAVRQLTPQLKQVLRPKVERFEF